MSERKILVIRPPEDNMGDCALCGDHAELRPYGPNGESICATCGMKDEEATKAKFRELL